MTAKSLTAPLSCLIYLQPLEKGDTASTDYKPEVEPVRYILYDRQGKADTHAGRSLEEVLYVKSIRFGTQTLFEQREPVKK